jgi:tetraacyldisaccharide-1-P 4'-kinase
VLLTTEKDWVKISRLATARDGLPIWRLQLQLRFRNDDEEKLLELIVSSLEKPAPAAATATPDGAPAS